MPTEAPTVAPVEAAKPIAPSTETQTAAVPTPETRTATATTKAIDASGDVQVGLDTLAQAAAEGEAKASQHPTNMLDEAVHREPGDDDSFGVAEGAEAFLQQQTGEDAGTTAIPEPVTDNTALDTTNPASQPAKEGGVAQPEPGTPQTEDEATRPEDKQAERGEDARRAEEETPEAQAKRRLEQGLEIAAKIIDLPGFEEGVPKAIIGAIKDNPELIDALHGPLAQAESADQLVLNLTNEIRKLSATEGVAAAGAPEAPNTPTEAPGPQSPAAEGAPSATPSSSGGESSNSNSEAAKKEEEKAQVEKLSKTKKLLIVALLILLGVSLSSVAAIPELK